MSEAELAVIGGSGFYQMEGLEEIESVRIATPFGDPSDAITLGTLEGVRVAFLPRHGIGHRLLPSELPVQANIWALKALGVDHIISISAVGSLREEMEPGHLVIPDQLIDRTKNRVHSFFGRGIVAHAPFADPFCPNLTAMLTGAVADAGATVHDKGTLVVMEGPLFSTRAESNLYRSWGAHLIGMTTLPEAKLAREAEICYAVVACVTDYDCWHESEEDVTADMVIANLLRNVETSKRLVRLAAGRLPARDCPCPSTLAAAILTAPELVPDQVKRDLAPILGRYMPAEAEATIG
ncbi:MAG: S-methyl-5'-thioadenosine phosphorylase [Chloroflexi bacterium]|nr:S-methyl-5'-thioadenosine phosphorylase [Chloroflexota bacterium]